jgi:hypothetical protein
LLKNGGSTCGAIKQVRSLKLSVMVVSVRQSDMDVRAYRSKQIEKRWEEPFGNPLKSSVALSSSMGTCKNNLFAI